ncbi:MAG: GvpL/GvpF family gas vesicle protein [Desulfobaccales bacterium]
MESPETIHGLYLYCLAWSDGLETVEVAGLNGHQPPLLTRIGEIAAIWSPVLLAEFCGPDAASRLQDLDWVGPRACRHEAVVESVMRRSPVLPLRFGTIFSSWGRLERVLLDHHEAIARFLTRVANQEEWAVKGLLDRPMAKQEFYSRKQAVEGEQLASLSPGRRYFLESRLRSEAEQELGRWLNTVCHNLLSELRNFVADLRERQVRPVAGEGQYQEMIFNWAFMVPKDTVPDFKSRIEAVGARLARTGLVLDCSGPWPPYSFSPALTAEAAP